MHATIQYLKGRQALIALSLAIFFMISAIPLPAQECYFPPKGEWERRSAAELGLDPDAVNKALEFVRKNEYSGPRNLEMAILKGFEHEPYHEIVGPVKERGGPAGLIIRNGYIVAEWGDVQRVDMTFSVTKSYLSTVAGLASDHKLIGSMKDRVSEYVWDGTFEGEHNQKIAWEDLLNQSSDWSGELFGMYDWADRPPANGGIDDWRKRELHEPGTHFKYNDVRVNVLAYSLLQVWRKPLPAILKEYIMDPIGASSTWRWYGYSSSWVNIDGAKVQSVSGGGHSGGGIFINTYDHARFGLLFMNMGLWENKRIISEEWIRLALEQSPANQSYGFLWWLNKGDRKIKGIPESVYHAAGFGGNYIIIDRINNLVIVTRWLEPAKRGEFLELLYKSL